MAREMKDSGIPWIGDIPESWKIQRYKHVMHKEKALCEHYNGEDIISLTMNGVIIRDLDAGGKMPTTFNGYQFVEPEDLLLCLFDIDVTPRCVGLVKNYGLTSPAYSRFKVHDGYHNAYYDYLLRMIDDRKIFVHLSKNLRSSLTESDFGVLPTIAPPCDEQKKIAAFLDAECSCIDSVIDQTRASIEEYKKLKQAVITQAVTKGIRPDRQMNDSGVPWIGIVPNDWQIAKLKYFSSIRSGVTLGKVYPRETELVEYPYLRVANVQGSHVDLTDVATIKVTEDEAIKYRLKDGELLMTEGGDRDKLGRGTVWHAQIDPCLHQNHVFALRMNDNLLAEYVSYLSASFVGRDYFDVTANQSVHLASTNSSTILNFRIPYPSIEEQREIISYLDDKTDKIDQMIFSKEKLLGDLDSYKKSLIYEYVTGKKEVPA